MKSVSKMDDVEFEQHVRVVCRMFAVRSYQEKNPGCSRADAWAYASRFWETHIETALDWLATCEADRELGEQVVSESLNLRSEGECGQVK